jgi:hypothetical protein
MAIYLVEKVDLKPDLFYPPLLEKMIVGLVFVVLKNMANKSFVHKNMVHKSLVHGC